MHKRLLQVGLPPTTTRQGVDHEEPSPTLAHPALPAVELTAEDCDRVVGGMLGTGLFGHYVVGEA
jgi:hypothetical protein